MLDTYRVKRRIKEIHKRLKVLNDKFKPLERSEFIPDDSLNAEAERHLQIAIQACIDIANHIIASLGLNRNFETVSEVFNELAKEHIIDGDFANIMISITGYRNVLVHGYLDVQREITYDNIQNRLPDLAQFAKYIEKFLEKKA
ncbi:MAG: hypothetical protein UT19_C0008G0015 [Candidatus Woesebacteria bacterium GW2011_GWB1_39_10b]|uniref:DUF86 domain-containing protein n=2 Tax=Candidatus Woeseibacteriota TaxID=1752722 RepID=A0A0G0M068_9BACT|nr:MAG: hypothetical protein UT19_C0008G0015 [Candidatus Woesebacteria bacterium GW2011_GWB1_39_10b]OGM63526.1 MAG: hypothetical protein A3A52_01325 [Candidatus Woesebacteria bacterium RIFCSPLOWO2_01_FULL_39_14]